MGIIFLGCRQEQDCRQVLQVIMEDQPQILTNFNRLCQLLGRPREYIQLHRDTTVNQLMFTTSLEGGIINYTDSPLLRAIKYGRVIIIDEADKAPEHVVAIFRSLAGQGEMSLSDGRRVRPVQERQGDIVVHPNFRLILLANRPGYRKLISVRLME